jgi:tetratricopeptide (TPR) repeat protein
MMKKITRRTASLAFVLPLLLACRSASGGAMLRAPEDPCAAPDTLQKASAAQSLKQEKKYAEAEAAARQALAACPGHAVAAAALGEALVAQKKYDEAVDRMSEVINAKQDVAYAYLWRGQAYYNKRQPDKMVPDFEMFVKLAPSAPEAATVQQLLASLKK